MYQDLDSIWALIKYSQLLVENENGEYRFFSYPNRAYGVTPLRFILEVLGPNYEVVVIEKDDPTQLSRDIHIRDVLINPDDQKIRLHYLFKPDEDGLSNGFEPLILSSNWLEVESYKVPIPDIRDVKAFPDN